MMPESYPSVDVCGTGLHGEWSHPDDDMLARRNDVKSRTGSGHYFARTSRTRWCRSPYSVKSRDYVCMVWYGMLEWVREHNCALITTVLSKNYTFMISKCIYMYSRHTVSVFCKLDDVSPGYVSLRSDGTLLIHYIIPSSNCLRTGVEYDVEGPNNARCHITCMINMETLLYSPLMASKAFWRALRTYCNLLAHYGIEVLLMIEVCDDTTRWSILNLPYLPDLEIRSLATLSLESLSTICLTSVSYMTEVCYATHLVMIVYIRHLQCLMPHGGRGKDWCYPPIHELYERTNKSLSYPTTHRYHDSRRHGWSRHRSSSNRNEDGILTINQLGRTYLCDSEVKVRHGQRQVHERLNQICSFLLRGLPSYGVKLMFKHLVRSECHIHALSTDVVCYTIKGVLYFNSCVGGNATALAYVTFVSGVCATRVDSKMTCMIFLFMRTLCRRLVVCCVCEYHKQVTWGRFFVSGACAAGLVLELLPKSWLLQL